MTVSCRVLKITRAPYYRWLAQPVSDAELDWGVPANALFDAHRDYPEFGYRHLLEEAAGARRCASGPRGGSARSRAGGRRSANPSGARPKKPGPPVHDDLCAVVDEHGVPRHEFLADGLNELWLASITEHKTGEGRLYLCAVKDAALGQT